MPHQDSGVRVKICGLTGAEGVRAAAEAGASHVGFVHFPPSPRHVGLDQAAALAREVPEGVAKVALAVDPDDGLIDALAGLGAFDVIQLHGGETPERVAQVRARCGLAVMKAVGISGTGDLPLIDAHAETADAILVDAKPPADSSRPGGNAAAFDWPLVAGRRWARPWFLAGGLDPDNVAEAIRRSGATGVDVSSGVESAPGIKDPDLVRLFARRARLVGDSGKPGASS